LPAELFFKEVLLKKGKHIGLTYISILATVCIITKSYLLQLLFLLFHHQIVIASSLCYTIVLVGGNANKGKKTKLKFLFKQLY
jgi:hypothetical protein